MAALVANFLWTRAMAAVPTLASQSGTFHFYIFWLPVSSYVRKVAAFAWELLHCISEGHTESPMLRY